MGFEQNPCTVTVYYNCMGRFIESLPARIETLDPNRVAEKKALRASAAFFRHSWRSLKKIDKVKRPESIIFLPL
jgi:hypothetical protein